METIGSSSSKPPRKTHHINLSPRTKDLPLEVWFAILLFLPDFRSRFSIAPTCWTAELACLTLFRDYVASNPSHSTLCFNPKFPKSLRKQNAQQNYSKHQDDFFNRRLFMDNLCFFQRPPPFAPSSSSSSSFRDITRSPSPFEDNFPFHQTIFADTKATSTIKNEKLFSYLPGRNQSYRLVSVLASSPSQIGIFSLGRMDPCISNNHNEITSLSVSPNGQIMSTTTTNSHETEFHLFQENDSFHYDIKVCNHLLPQTCWNQPNILGDEFALFACSLKESGLLKMNLETQQLTDHVPLTSGVSKFSLISSSSKCLLGMDNGSTLLFDPRMDSTTLLSPPSSGTIYPPIEPVFRGNPFVYLFTNTSTGALECISSNKPNKKYRLPTFQPNEKVRSLAVLDHFFVVGNLSGATCWDARMISHNPLSRFEFKQYRSVFACDTVLLDSCKYIIAGQGREWGVSTYAGEVQKVFTSQYELKFLECAPNETMWASSHQGNVVHTELKVNRKLPKTSTDNIFSTTQVVSSSTTPTSGVVLSVATQAELEAEARVRLAIAKRKKQLQEMKAQLVAERKAKREQTKAIASMRWSKFGND